VDINDKMRAILVDWLVEVHLKFKVSFWSSNDTKSVASVDSADTVTILLPLHMLL